MTRTAHSLVAFVALVSCSSLKSQVLQVEDLRVPEREQRRIEDVIAWSSIKRQCHSDSSHHVLHVPDVRIAGPQPEASYLDGTFYKKIEFLHDHWGFWKSKHLHCHSLVSNGANELLAWVELGRTSIACNAPANAWAAERYLLSLSRTNDSLVVVSMSLGMGTNYLYCVDGTWRIIVEEGGEVQDLPLSTFIRSNWELIVKGGEGLPLE